MKSLKFGILLGLGYTLFSVAIDMVFRGNGQIALAMNLHFTYALYQSEMLLKLINSIGFPAVYTLLAVVNCFPAILLVWLDTQIIILLSKKNMPKYMVNIIAAIFILLAISIMPILLYLS